MNFEHKMFLTIAVVLFLIATNSLLARSYFITKEELITEDDCGKAVFSCDRTEEAYYACEMGCLYYPVYGCANGYFECGGEDKVLDACYKRCEELWGIEIVDKTGGKDE